MICAECGRTVIIVNNERVFPCEFCLEEIKKESDSYAVGYDTGYDDGYHAGSIDNE